MINELYFYGKIIAFLLKGNVVRPEIIQRDYDKLSRTYDDYFSRYVGKYSRELVRRLELAPGSKVVDLACGTGTLSLAIAESVGEKGKVTGVDRSQGMLAVAEKKCRARGFSNTTFVEADIRDVFTGFEDNSLDAVTCGWAIGYVNPQDLVSAAARKIRNGGKIGLIENVRDTLAPIRKTAVKVAQELPRHFNQLMDLHFRLPKDSGDIKSLFMGADLQVLDSWEGDEKFEFRSGEEVLNWVLHTGASAGFDTVMDRAAKKECDELFVRLIEKDFLRDGRIVVTHKFAAGIAQKEE
ncbi:MAG: methyltransferase domain-containing protein [Kiritimatiellae bacterium]|nr:methyltransferase domain-containing protein [Kiritimatiellia bacterium]MDD5522303.1 methyltransferase domain-containing protein [Kiritimatiellia bacterium]